MSEFGQATQAGKPYLPADDVQADGIAHDAVLSREILYETLSGDRNPSLNTVLGVVGAPA